MLDLPELDVPLRKMTCPVLSTAELITSFWPGSNRYWPSASRPHPLGCLRPRRVARAHP
jgi:hypothetical protein